MRQLHTLSRLLPAYLQRASLLLMVLVFLGTSSAAAAPLTEEQGVAYSTGTAWYNRDFQACVGGQASGTAIKIVIDPGHSGTAKGVTDPTTGLYDYDYPVDNESDEDFYVSLKAKQQLVAAGYQVTLTKGDDISPNDVTSVTDPKVKKGAALSATFRERAEVANKINADLAFSVHDDHTQPWGSWAQLYTQKTANSGGETLYRENEGGGSHTTFKDDKVAALSQQYGKAFDTERAAAEGRAVDNTDANFAGRAPISPGTIPMVMLFSKVPWVYNEVGAGPAGQYLSQDKLDAYVKGLVNSVKKAKPATQQSGSNLSGKDNVQKVFNFFVGKGLNGLQAAAIIGNLEQESGDKVSPTAVNSSSGAYGIAQWLGGRKDTLFNYADTGKLPTDKDSDKPAPKRDKSDLGLQLDYFWWEVTKGPEVAGFHALDHLKAADTIEKATEGWHDDFERSAKDEANIPHRIEQAKKVLALYGKDAPTSGSATGDSTTVCDDSGTAAIDCQNIGDGNAGNLSQVRQNIVCIMKAEYGLWKDGKIKRGTDFHKYSQGRDENWCADFVSWVYKQAGHPVTGNSEDWNRPAVVQLSAIGQKQEHGFAFHNPDGYTPKPGDIIIWDTGEHTNMVSDVKDANNFTIIGGNQDSGGNGFTNSGVTSYDVNKGGVYGGQRITGFVSPD